MMDNDQYRVPQKKGINKDRNTFNSFEINLI